MNFPITSDDLRGLNRVQRDMLIEILDNTRTDIERDIITLPHALKVVHLIGRILERAEQNGGAS